MVMGLLGAVLRPIILGFGYVKTTWSPALAVTLAIILTKNRFTGFTV